MNGVCLTCGITTDLEPFTALDAHHVAGRRNHARLTVLVCRACHQILSSWQRAAGIDLEGDSPRTELDMLRALAVGATHLLRLYAERHGQDSPIPAPLAVHTARAISRLMDSSGDPGRPARWLPDPRVPPTDVVPVGPARDDPARIREVAELLRELSEELDIETPLSTDLLRAISEQPDRFQDALSLAFGQPHTAEELVDLHALLIRRGAAVLRKLLQVPDFDHLDGLTLEEARTWIDTGVRLLERVLQEAPPPLDEGEK